MSGEYLRSGDLIRATWLNQLRRDIGNMERRIGQLEQALGIAERDIGMSPFGLDGRAGAINSMPTSLTWTEVGATRGSASKVITDSTGDTHTIDQATKIRMTASSGGTSYSWTFQFATS